MDQLKPITPALQFLAPDAEEGFLICPAAAAALRKLGSRAACILSNSGPFKVGKSFLLNSLLGKGEFQTSADINTRGTVGIFMQIFDFHEHALIVLDCQGTGSPHGDRSLDFAISSLCIVLSSVILHHTRGALDEPSFQSLAVECAVVRSLSADADPPSLIWLLRDFVLALETTDGRPLSSAAYLENSLNQSGSAIEVRRAIVEAFPSRDCEPLVCPIIDEDALSNLSLQKTRLEFRVQLARVRGKVFQLLKSRPKLVGNEILRSGLIPDFSARLLLLLKSGAMGAVQSTWKNVRDESFDLARRISTKKFTAALAQLQLPMNAGILLEISNSIKADAEACFAEIAIGSGKSRFSDFQDYLMNELENFKEENSRLSQKSISATEDKLLAGMKTDLPRDFVSHCFSEISKNSLITPEDKFSLAENIVAAAAEKLNETRKKLELDLEISSRSKQECLAEISQLRHSSKVAIADLEISHSNILQDKQVQISSLSDWVREQQSRIDTLVFDYKNLEISSQAEIREIEDKLANSISEISVLKQINVELEMSLTQKNMEITTLFADKENLEISFLNDHRAEIKELQEEKILLEKSKNKIEKSLRHEIAIFSISHDRIVDDLQRQIESLKEEISRNAEISRDAEISRQEIAISRSITPPRPRGLFSCLRKN